MTMTPAERDQLAYFNLVQEGFERAGEAAGVVERDFAIAEQTLRLRFAGPALVEGLSRAFAHLAVEPHGDPDFTVCIWDSRSTGAPLPLLIDTMVEFIRRNRWEALGEQHTIKRYHGERIRTLFHFGPHILMALDQERAMATYWLEDAATLPYYEKGYPLSRLLNWWLEKAPLQLIHAAAVGTPEGAVLLPGKSGSGKSTTTLTCLQSSLFLLSDDTTLVRCDPTPHAYSLFSTAKVLTQDKFRRLPFLAGHASNPHHAPDEKALFFLNEHFPERLLRAAPLRAILVPHITGEPDSRVTPASRGEALLALGPSTLLQLPNAGQKAFTMLSALVRRLPCYRLELGTDMEQIPLVIARLLAGLSA